MRVVECTYRENYLWKRHPWRGVVAGTSKGYRYGFNGKENDNEAKEEGNQHAYGFRIYDPRVAKFLSVDPLTQEYPWYTPYQFAGNTPIQAIDRDGAKKELSQFGSAFRQKAAMQKAHAELIIAKRWKIPENHIAIPDIYGNGWIGPESRTRERVAGIKRDYDVALGEALQGPASLMYSISGDEGAFKGQAVDQIYMSFGGIPAENSSVLPRKAKIEEVKQLFFSPPMGGAVGKSLRKDNIPVFRDIQELLKFITPKNP